MPKRTDVKNILLIATAKARSIGLRDIRLTPKPRLIVAEVQNA